MTAAALDVLLIEDSPGDARLIQELLRDAGPHFTFAWADRLATGLERLRSQRFAVVLLDLALPDSQGAATFAAIKAQAPDTPIIVLTGLGDEALALKLLQEGAQDYLIKGQSDGHLLARSIRYGIERQHIRAELHSSQERMTAIVDSALDAIVTMDETGAITRWNPQAEVVFGWSVAEAVGQHLADLLIPPAARPAHQQGLERFLATGSGPILGKRVELTAVRRDETEFPVELTVTPVRLESGWSFSAFIRDISERKLAERQIALLTEGLERRVAERTSELAAINEELESFTYSVSHDLRAPLRHVDGFVRILEEHLEGGLDPQAQHYLQRIHEGAQQMGRLVDDLLNLARVGRQSPTVRATALRPVVEDIIAGLAPEQANRRVEWRLGDLPEVACDPGLVRVALTNLLSNAVKYTRPRDPAVIEVGTTQQHDERVFFVKDNGVGFDMKHADKLFGVFQRLHRSEDFEGTGVGLATVQRIVRKHGGRIWADAAPDRGSTFFFTLASPAGRV